MTYYYTMKHVHALESVGVTYHAFGMIKNGRKKVADYYKTDKLTSVQLDALRAMGLEVRTCSPEYAPEIKNPIICFPKGWHRKAKGGSI